MKCFVVFVIISLFVAIDARKPIRCHPVTEPQCPKGEIYQQSGPGPFCYATCCGPRGPPCRLGTFTTGCFCADPNAVKIFPVANNTVADPSNHCVTDCSTVNCAQAACTSATNQEWRTCGPTSMCDNQVCRGMRPICTEEEAAICVEGCFCMPGYSRFNGECIKECPLLP